VKLYATFSDGENLYQVLDYAINRDLSAFLATNRKLFICLNPAGFHNFNVRKYYASQLVCILEYLRLSRVVHRDLKPANLLMNERW
jgi:serine/threonine protein kinase